MVRTGTAITLAVLSCFQFTNGKRTAAPAFLVRLCTIDSARTKAGSSHHCQIPGRRQRTAMTRSATEKSEVMQQELSDIDARVLNELLRDPSFVESLLEQGPDFENSARDDKSKDFTNNTVIDDQLPTKNGLTVAGDKAPGGGRVSSYDSVTMQVVEGLQDSMRGLIAKVSAAVESAGIYVVNRAQVDAKVVQAVAQYASTQAASGTGRLLLAATGATSPALLLMGVNTTETQTALNDTLQLLSMGIVPDSIGLSPKLLPSFKDFGDDDKRLDAAYRRQRRRRSKPLPAKLLGALPSTINKAADLAYEVKQEVKYERAGNRANKLLKPFGLLLPEARDTSRLLGGSPNSSPERTLKASDARSVPIATIRSPAQLPNADASETATKLQAAASSGEARRTEAVPREPATSTSNRPHGFRSTRQKSQVPDDEGWSISKGVAATAPELGIEPDVIATMIERPHVLAEQLMLSTIDADSDVRAQERRVRAANAVLSSLEPIIAGLAESHARETTLLEGHNKAASNMQGVGAPPKAGIASEATERYLERLGKLRNNMMELETHLRTYAAAAQVSLERLVVTETELRTARDCTKVLDGQRLAEDFVCTSVGLLQSLADEQTRLQQGADTVEARLGTVWRQTAERANYYGGGLHEDALVAACRLWEASAAEVRKGGAGITNIEECVREVKREVFERDGESEEVSPKDAAAEGRKGGRTHAIPITETGGQDATRGNGQPDKDPRSHAGERNAWQDSEAHVRSGRSKTTVGPNDSKKVGESPYTVHAVPSMAAGPGSSVDTAEPNVIVDISDAGYSQSFTRESALNKVMDATVVSDSTTQLPREGEKPTSGGPNKSTSTQLVPERLTRVGSEELGIEVVVDDTQTFVDIEADVEDISDSVKVGMKVLDVAALLLEKVFFVGLPTLVSSGALIWERVDNAVNGAKGREGWVLLKRLKKDALGQDELANEM